MDWWRKGRKEVICNESMESLLIEKILFNIGLKPEGDDFLEPAVDVKELGPVKVFISYSKSDKIHAENMRKYLKPLERNQKITTFIDDKLQAGQEWDATIKENLRTADIILLLVSQDFINTDYIWDVEIKTALERHENEKTTVIPIILEKCIWQGEATPFSKLTALPDKVKTITTWGKENEAWVHTYGEIKKVIDMKN